MRSAAAQKLAAHGTFWPWGLRDAPSSLPSVRRRVSSRAIRSRFASRCVVAEYLSLPRLRLGAYDAHRRRVVALRSLFGRVRRPRPEKRWRFYSLCLAATLAHRLGAEKHTGMIQDAARVF
jgi:hypothetical protein